MNACITYLALHEFGHVAGLRHEHARADSTCKKSDELIEEEQMKSEEFSASAAYDPNSIMNYCYRDIVLQEKLQASEIRLSASDIEVIKKLYNQKRPAPIEE